MPKIVQPAVTVNRVDTRQVTFAHELRGAPPTEQLVGIHHYALLTDGGAVHEFKAVGRDVPPDLAAIIEKYLEDLDAIAKQEEGL